MNRHGRYIDLKICKKQYLLLVMTVLCTFVLVIGRLAWIQLYKGRDMQAYAGEQMKLYLQTNTPRGKIVDREGEELAVSVMVGTLTCDPFNMRDENKEDDKTPPRDLKRLSADLLGPIVNVPKEELYQRFTTPDSRFQYVKRMMTPEEVKACRKVIEENDLKGFYWQEESQRYYTKGRLAAQVLGFVGTDDKGLAGIEQELDEKLHGKLYKRSIIYDALGHQMLGGTGSKLDSWKLSTVYLTIDSKMQSVLEESMDTALEKTHARGAAAIIMDPYTGEILAMVSRPTFNPNEYYKYADVNWNNKAVSMIYEPGSVFKPIVGCMGMSEGLINGNTQINDTGSIAVADSVISNWDGEGSGVIPFSDVIKFSINTGMVQVGQMLGGEKEMYYAKRFGFGTVTGIELPGEEDGILFGDGSEMYPTEIATVAIGQGIAVTPIQVVRAISAIANGGELLKPYIVKKIVDANGQTIEEHEKVVVRRVITEEIAAEMRGMMEQVVASGGGKAAGIKGYRIAGKTGTAEKIREEGGGYIEGVYIASFVGFVPADKPRYVMLVMLDSPQGAFYGSQVAAPVFRDTLQQILTAKGIMPSSSEDLPSLDIMNAAGESQKGFVRPKVELLPQNKVKLPDFKGADMRMAAEVLQTGHLRMKPYGSGLVVSQRPAPGTVVDEHSIVELWFK